jgi:serine/threonine protein kinase/formylglycine-generating enzyme required for sulfatase activity
MTIMASSGLRRLSGEDWAPPTEFDEFRIVRSLGAGAMGHVYLAQDLLLERAVAVKFVHAGDDPEARAHVIEEARAIARLQHPNVVAIYRVADLAGHPYLVSEYVHGRALNQLPRPMPWRQVRGIAIDLARGLAAAHRRGVLHRDVKPGNAILADDGRAKLLDFGLAVILDGAPAEDLASARPAAVVSGDDTLPPDGSAPPTLATALGSDRPPPSVTARATHDERQPIGTPMYMAPEVWRGEPATRRSDLYSLGILLYELIAGTAPFRDVALAELSEVVQRRAIPPLAEVAPGVDPQLAAIVDRLVARDPAGRLASADALLAALEDSAPPRHDDERPDVNPYRGLAAFDSAHAALFFGRRAEIRELVDRVRSDALVVVGGDSGTGKSSLCRAGVLPRLAQQDGWSCVEVVPGRHPVRALAIALAPWTGRDEAALRELLGDSPDAVARAIRGHDPARRLLLFVDQLEELLTFAVAEEGRAFARAIAAIAVRAPSVRVLTTCRSDFLSRLAMLPELGDELARGLYFLRPLTGDHVREVIVRPAAAKGVTFESDALIDTLVAQTEHAPGGLPLLQFTLAELWDARDREARTIRAAALTAAGGVAGALSRHADRLLAGLSADERGAARRLLLRLVTAEGTRIRRAEAELFGDGAAQGAERAALEVLVRGRVVVANNAEDGAYEIAHEALLTSWSTLQGWLQRDAANQAVLERVAQAAAAWDRMGRGADLLWGRRQLAEARALDRDALARHQAAFLDASAAALRRRRAVGAAIAAAVVLGAVGTGLAIHARAREELDGLVAKQARAAMTGQAAAAVIAGQHDLARAEALARFDRGAWDAGEQAWADVEALARREDAAYRGASAHLESILLLDPGLPGLRGWLADLTFDRLVRADRDRRGELSEELASRLATYDDGVHRARLAAQAQLRFAVTPAGTRVSVERAGAVRLLGTAPLAETRVAPGSVVLVFEAAGRVPARLPMLIARGEQLEVVVDLPRDAPPDMVYVPRGRFLFGSADGSDARRQLLNTAPLHEVTTEPYFIARHEVTFAAWIAFLDDLPLEERRRRSPSSYNAVQSVTLTEVAPRRWRLSLRPTTKTYVADAGEPIRYEGRARRAAQDWLRMPVSAVSYEDALAFAHWLDRTGRLPGARLCNEYEWERAARGADGRSFPSGASLAPDDANIDQTYDRVPLAFGPDEVGTHPASRSPVGAEDLAGNVWEWTTSMEKPGDPLVRGGCWYQGALSARSMNREPGEPTERTPLIGLRLCVTPR